MKHYFYRSELLEGGNETIFAQGIAVANDEVSPADVFAGLVNDLETKFPGRTARILAFNSVS